MRPVHYLGIKSRYLSQIGAAMDRLATDGSTVVDLFAGTGVVSRALARSHPVVSVDVQSYSATLSSALCSPTSYDEPTRGRVIARARAWMEILPEPVDRLLQIESDLMTSATHDPLGFVLLTEEGSLSNLTATDPKLASAKAEAAPHLAAAGAVLTMYYGGVYFSYRQALELDAIMAAIGHRAESPAEPTLVAAILGVASDVVATVGGHFAQPLRLRARTGEPKHSAIKKSLNSRRASVFAAYEGWLLRYSALAPTEYECSPTTADYRTALNGLEPGVAAIYADPPYTRDHYSRFYHVLETIALADDPGVANAPGSELPSRGLYRAKRHQSPFSIRSQAIPAFSSLFELASQQGIPVVLSYSPQGGGTQARPETRLMTIDQIVDIASSRYKRVEVIPIEASTHSRLNRVDLHGTTAEHAEVLLIAR